MTDPLGLFGLLGPTAAELNESNQSHATAYGALIILLIDKGVFTHEEYDRAYIRAQHIISQEFARKRDEAEAQFEQDSPNLAWLLKKMKETQ